MLLLSLQHTKLPPCGQLHLTGVAVSRLIECRRGGEEDWGVALSSGPLPRRFSHRWREWFHEWVEIQHGGRWMSLWLLVHQAPCVWEGIPVRLQPRSTHCPRTPQRRVEGWSTTTFGAQERCSQWKRPPTWRGTRRQSGGCNSSDCTSTARETIATPTARLSLGQMGWI